MCMSVRLSNHGVATLGDRSIVTSLISLKSPTIHGANTNNPFLQQAIPSAINNRATRSLAKQLQGSAQRISI